MTFKYYDKINLWMCNLDGSECSKCPFKTSKKDVNNRYCVVFSINEMILRLRREEILNENSK